MRTIPVAEQLLLFTDDVDAVPGRAAPALIYVLTGAPKPAAAPVAELRAFAAQLAAPAGSPPPKPRATAVRRASSPTLRRGAKEVLAALAAAPTRALYAEVAPGRAPRWVELVDGVPSHPAEG